MFNVNLVNLSDIKNLESAERELSEIEKQQIKLERIKL